MNFLQKLKNKLYYNSLNKSLNKIRTLRLSTSLEETDTVGLLFNASNEEQTSVVLKYTKKLSNQGKKVSVLGYFDTKKELEDIAARILGNQEEVKRLSEQLMSQKLLNLYKTEANIKTKEITYDDFVKEFYS